MNDKTEVIVLRQRDFRENDAIVNVLSKDFGHLSFIARGIKKINSKNANSCNIFNISRFYFNYKENGLLNLRIAENIESFVSIRNDLLKQTIAGIMVEVMDSMNTENIDICYDLLKKSLYNLSSSDNSIAVLGLFFAKCNDINGISPDFDHCVKCGTTEGIVSISPHNGGFICKNCFDPKYDKRRSKTVLKSARLFSKANIDQFEIIEKLHFEYIDIKDTIDIFTEYSGVDLKGVEFLEDILRIK